jgi:L,D-transpeptidase YcbB
MRFALVVIASLVAPPLLAQGFGNGPLPTGGFSTFPASPAPAAPAITTPEPQLSAPKPAKPRVASEKKSPPRTEAARKEVKHTGSIPTTPAEPHLDQPVPPAPKPRAKAKPPAPIAAPNHKERLVAKNDPRPTVHPDSLALIQEAATRYRAAADQGGWPILPTGLLLKPGSEGDAVLTLRERLAIEGDLPREAVGNPRFDAELARAVKNFQGRLAFRQDGVVGGLTLKALRVPADERARQLEESAKRLAAKANFPFGPRYVVVNIPSASVEGIANGAVERRHIAVVGKSDRASPEVATRITNVNFNPTWTVPVSIIKKDIIPKMQKDPSYLAKSKIRIYGASGAEIDPARIDWNTERATAFTLRQDSGEGNSLGQIRIDMPNRHAVYMHDTPSKRLFLRDDRFHSSGCVRVEDVRGFVEWLLKPVPHGASGWDQPAIAEAIAGGQRKDVRLKEPVPVIWTYLTGFVTPDGQVHFRDDVYSLDDGRPAIDALDAIAREATAPPVQSSQRRETTAPAVLPAAESEPRTSRVLYSRPAMQRIDP